MWCAPSIASAKRLRLRLRPTQRRTSWSTVPVPKGTIRIPPNALPPCARASLRARGPQCHGAALRSATLTLNSHSLMGSQMSGKPTSSRSRSRAPAPRPLQYSITTMNSPRVEPWEEHDRDIEQRQHTLARSPYALAAIPIFFVLLEGGGKLFEAVAPVVDSQLHGLDDIPANAREQNVQRRYELLSSELDDERRARHLHCRFFQPTRVVQKNQKWRTSARKAPAASSARGPRFARALRDGGRRRRAAHGRRATCDVRALNVGSRAPRRLEQPPLRSFTSPRRATSAVSWSQESSSGSFADFLNPAILLFWSRFQPLATSIENSGGRVGGRCRSPPPSEECACENRKG